MVEPWSNAHGVMPGDWKCPPHQRPQNALKESERENVALAREKPRHCCSADPRKWNEHGVRPMERGEKRTRDQGSAHRVIRCSEKTTGDVGIQPHLLEKAKGHVAEEMFRDEEMAEWAMQSAETNSYDTECADAGQEDYCRALGSGPQIVCAPAERLRRVLVENKTGAEPNGENNPGIPHRSLKLPDVPSDKSAKREHLD